MVFFANVPETIYFDVVTVKQIVVVMVRALLSLNYNKPMGMMMKTQLKFHPILRHVCAVVDGLCNPGHKLN